LGEDFWRRDYLWNVVLSGIEETLNAMLGAEAK
jgi:hypothetical protein